RRWWGNDVARSTAASASSTALRLGRIRIGRAASTSATAASRRGAARTNRSRFTGAQVIPVRRTVLRFGVSDRPVAPIVGGVEAAATADAIPIRIDDASRAANRARTAPRSVVLQSTAHVVRLPHVSADCIELTERHQADFFPRLALVVADVQAA